MIRGFFTLPLFLKSLRRPCVGGFAVPLLTFLPNLV